MKNRKAFNVRGILVAFNAAQLILSLFLLLLLSVSHCRGGFASLNFLNILGSNLFADRLHLHTTNFCTQFWSLLTPKITQLNDINFHVTKAKTNTADNSPLLSQHWWITYNLCLCQCESQFYPWIYDAINYLECIQVHLLPPLLLHTCECTL